MKIRDIINERYVNLVGDSPEVKAKKKRYSDDVWNMLQKSYADIGGIKGSGFESPEAMVDKIPFWKIGVRDGKPVSVSMYKDKAGRKAVAIGTDGSADGKHFVDDTFSQDYKRAYSEKSKGSLGKLLKTVPWDELEKYIIKPADAAKLLGDPVTPVAGMSPEDLPADAQKTLERWPQLDQYGYLRDLGGAPTFKVMVGSPEKKITPK